MKRSAFTLIEVLLSIALLALIMLALNRSVELLRDSNSRLFEYLSKSKDDTKMLDTLYKDIAGSDGNLTITKDEFTRLCINHTANSLYALPSAKVCWVVLKKDNQLVRIEGNGYSLPVKYEEKVEIDPLIKHLELFDVNQQNDKVLVTIKKKGEEAIGFMVQGLTAPPKKTTPANTPQKPVQGTTPPSPVRPAENVPVSN